MKTEQNVIITDVNTCNIRAALTAPKEVLSGAKVMSEIEAVDTSSQEINDLRDMHRAKRTVIMDHALREGVRNPASSFP